MKRNILRLHRSPAGRAWGGFLTAALLFCSCATDSGPKLKEYCGAPQEQMEIVRILLDLEQALNSSNAGKILSLYTPEAGIMMDLEGKRVGVLLTKQEYGPELEQKLGRESFRQCSYRFHFLAPKEIFVSGGDALATVPLEVYGTRCYYREKAVFHFELTRMSCGWLISKSTWEVLESTHEGFQKPKT